MKKVLIAYQSKTGNTEKVANAVYDGITAADKTLAVIEPDLDATGYDLVIVGFPVMVHSVPEKAAALLKQLPEGQKFAMFATHGCRRGGKLAKTAFEYGAGLPPKGKLMGTLGVRGKVQPAVLEVAQKDIELKSWAEEAVSANTHPDDADLADAAEFGLNMLTKARG